MYINIFLTNRCAFLKKLCLTAYVKKQLSVTNHIQYRSKLSPYTVHRFLQTISICNSSKPCTLQFPQGEAVVVKNLAMPNIQTPPFSIVKSGHCPRGPHLFKFPMTSPVGVGHLIQWQGMRSPWTPRRIPWVGLGTIISLKSFLV